MPSSLSFDAATAAVVQLVVLLHGRGADGNDLIGLATMLATQLPDALFLAPEAPHPCDGAPFGLQWFSLIDRSPENIAAGVRGAAPALDEFLDHHLARHGLSDENLALFGFSQGATDAGARPVAKSWTVSVRTSSSGTC